MLAVWSFYSGFFFAPFQSLLWFLGLLRLLWFSEMTALVYMPWAWLSRGGLEHYKLTIIITMTDYTCTFWHTLHASSIMNKQTALTANSGPMSTSKPRSAKPVAMTLAPRSWPSCPTLATSILGRRPSRSLKDCKVKYLQNRSKQPQFHKQSWWSGKDCWACSARCERDTQTVNFNLQTVHTHTHDNICLLKQG